MNQLQENQLAKKAIILCFDRPYCEQAIVTIKSLCAHQRGLRIYVFNKGDIPQEWFAALQGWLKPFDSEIVNIRLPEEELAMRHFNLQNSAHISATKFLIYYIADYVKEDIALYLDCDLIVTGNVVHLLDYDLDGYYIAAVNDSELDPRTNKDVEWELNSGVMLVNIKRWKRENVRDWLLNLSEEHYKEVRNGEQSIMIMAFGQEWLPLDDTYNFFVGYDVYDKSEYRLSRTRLVDNQLPLVLHYIGGEKPWGTMSRNRFTSLWWFYYGLDWSTILNTHLFNLALSEYNHSILRPRLVVFTTVEELECLDELVQSLPECDFDIFAPTMMSNVLLAYGQYPNVHFYQNSFNPIKYDNVLETALAVLDISQGMIWQDPMDIALKLKVAVLAFPQTNHVGEQAQVCETSQLMVDQVKQLIADKKHLNIL